MITPEMLYHGSSFKQDILKPGFAHTGLKVEWDRTESNEFLYADEDTEEAISMAFASTIEQKYKLSHYQTKGNRITITLAKGEKKVDKNELSKLKGYIYYIANISNDGWVKVNNQYNHSTTEWKTKKHIDQNLLGLSEINFGDWLKQKELNVIIESNVSTESDKDSDVGDDIKRIREFGEKKDLPEETINASIVDELKDQKEEKEKTSTESLTSFKW